MNLIIFIRTLYISHEKLHASKLHTSSRSYKIRPSLIEQFSLSFHSAAMSYRGAFLTFSVTLTSLLGGVNQLVLCVLESSANDAHFR